MSEIDTDGLPTVVALDPEHRQSRYRCLTTVNTKALKVGDVVIVQNCIGLPKQEAVVLSILRREIVEPSLLAKIPHESSSISLNDIVNETEKTQTSQSPNSASEESLAKLLAFGASFLIVTLLIGLLR